MPAGRDKARKRERYVEEYELPSYLWSRVRERLPGLAHEEMDAFCQGGLFRRRGGGGGS